MNSYVVLLLAYAQIAATLTGFIGVVSVLGDRSKGRPDTSESAAVFHLLLSALGALFLSLFAALLLVLLATDEHLAWRIANGLSGCVHLIGASHLAVETWRQENGLQAALVPIAIGMTTAFASIAAAAGYLPRAEVLVFMLATLWALCITVISFVSLLIAARRVK